ncbi:MAG: hypothetical protein M3Y56_01985, partial [Armatimonadota bacterium]|nr:hypothetical protein [Armatimonadota bacterium]
MKNSAVQPFHRILPFALLILLTLGSVLRTSPAAAVVITSKDNSISVQLDEAAGLYQVTVREPGWTFGGALGGPAVNAATHTGVDRIGPYAEITFDWTGSTMPLSGSIRVYADRPVVRFSDTCRAASEMAPPAFPDFRLVPQGLYRFSYSNHRFAPPVLGLDE